MKWLLIIFAGIASAVGFIVYYESRPETIQTRKEEAKARADEKLPRKVNEADRWLYFTRCGASSTETVNTWDECRTVQSGKTTRQECTPKNMAIAQQPKGQTP